MDRDSKANLAGEKQERSCASDEKTMIVVLGAGVIGVTTAFYLARAGHAVTGDCLMFTRGLAKKAVGLGVKFVFDTRIERLLVGGDRISGIVTNKGGLSADAYLVTMGSYSPLLLEPLGLDLPVHPVKGYSITLPIRDADLAPVSTVMDETFKVAVTRLGNRIRVGGTAEIAGYDRSLNSGCRSALEH